MKPTQALAKRLRRLALTTKQTNKGYYKGTGSGSMGSHTKHGGYLMDWDKVRTYVVPDLSNFKLTPFITKNMAARPKVEGREWRGLEDGWNVRMLLM
ncbi:hypothetical protein VTL71DRAFT_396, partial [Oculimacula yallundae]